MNLNATSERLYFMLLAFLTREIPFLLYLLASYIYAAFPSVFDQYRIQKAKDPPQELINKALRQALFDHTIMQIPLLWFSYDLFLYIGCPQLNDPFPSIQTAFLHFAIFIVLCDTLTYWAHRALHHPALYARFHKQHHEFIVSHTVTSSYFSPLDDFLTGVIPTLCGPLLLRSHVGIVFLWIALRICETSESHSGYALPFSIFYLGRPADWHDYHHSHNIGNFAPFFTFWDVVCGTDVSYRNYKRKKMF